MRQRELIVDSFAGGGGASLGIEWAIGRSPDVAINHNPAAIEMHTRNHPTTRHYKEDVFKVNPREVTRGRPVGLLHLSPDCTHFSRAKGGKPVKKSIRGLAWVAIKWAVEAAPRVMILENVREFQDWGPLVNRWVCRADCGWKGTESQTTLLRSRRRCPRCESLRVCPTEDMVPCPDRKGLTFRRFVGRLKACGYAVEWKVLNAADFGAPTHRRRLFLVARNDGEEIGWPEPTHGDPKKIGRDLFSLDLKPWRTAAECIDWSIPRPSIFDRKKPLAEKTLKRIALGIRRYVLDNPKPFIVGVGGRAGQSPATGADSPVGTVTAKNDRAVVVPEFTPLIADMQRDNRPRGVDEPAATVTTQGNRQVLVSPVITPVTHAGERRANGPLEPLPTVTGANRGEMAVIAPVLSELAHGEAGRWGAGTPDINAPIGTIHAGGKNFALIAPTLVPHYGKSTAASVEQPHGTVMPGGHGKSVLIAPTLVQTGFGEREGQAPRALDLHKPLGTVAGTGKHAVVSAFLAKHYGGVVGTPADVPVGTVTAVDHHSVVAANLVHLNHGDKTASGVDEPARTVTASGTHAALVYSFLTKYFSSGGQWQAANEPLHTVTAKDRLSVVTVTVEGVEYVITDIGMRMLKPRELARAQGFPDSYILTGTATNQVERIGNSVSPPVEKAVVEAQGFTPAVKRVRGAKRATAGVSK